MKLFGEMDLSQTLNIWHHRKAEEQQQHHKRLSCLPEATVQPLGYSALKRWQAQAASPTFSRVFAYLSLATWDRKLLNTKNLKQFLLQTFMDLEFSQTIFKGNSIEKLQIWIRATPCLSMYHPTKRLPSNSALDLNFNCYWRFHGIWKSSLTRN